MSSLIIGVGILSGLILLTSIWNKFSRRYNYGILKNSACKNCGEILGDKSLEIAISKLDKEKEKLKHEAKLGAVKLHNMELACPNCTTINFERDLYKTNRKKNTKQGYKT